MIKIEEEQGKQFLRFTTLDGRAAVEQFIAEAGIAADLSRSYMTSGGNINGRQFEMWHAPIGEPSEMEREMFRLNARRGDPWAPTGKG